MRVISKAAITDFARERSDALEALMHWCLVTKRARWKNLADLHADFPHADLVGVFTVFNIGGNKYRLIAIVKYRWQTVYIRHIVSHREYTREKWKQ